MLSDAENWLYDHWEEKLEVYTAKLDEVSAVGDPIKYRAEQAEKRPEVVQAAKMVIERVRADATSGPEVEKYAHIEQEEKDKVTAECDRVSAQLDTKLSEQVRNTSSPRFCISYRQCA